MFCRFCGTKLKDDARFCPNCGKAVKRASEIYTQPKEKNVSHPVSQQKDTKREEYQAVTGQKPSIFNLCAQFPTDEKRYQAYIIFLCISFAISFIYSLLDLKQTIDSIGSFGLPTESSALFTLFAFATVVVSLVSIYIAVYLWWKTKIIPYVLKLLLGFIVSGIIFSILGEISGWLVFLCWIGTIIGNRACWQYLKPYKRYIWYIFMPVVLSFVVALIIIFFMAMSLDSLSRSFFLPVLIGIMGAAVAGIIGLLLPLIISIYIMKSEQKRGMPFLQVCRLLYTIPLTIFMLIFGISMLIPVPILSGKILLREFNFDANPEATTESVLKPDTNLSETDKQPANPIVEETASPSKEPAHDMTAASDTDKATAEHQIPPAKPMDIGVEETADTPLTDILKTLQCVVDANVVLHAANMAGNIVLRNTDGDVIMQLSGGKIQGTQGVLLGLYEENTTLQRIDFFTSAHQLVYSTDTEGVYYDANEFPIAKLIQEKGMELVVDTEHRLIYKVFNGTIFASNGTIIGAITTESK